MASSEEPREESSEKTLETKLTAHLWHVAPRTDDVHHGEKISFAALHLSDETWRGLQRSGFEQPSPIQLKAIPLGRCGFDLVVQAKSGTGKTCVFAVVALESIDLSCAATQVLVLAPTREIAVQIQDVINAIGCCKAELSCQTFIGGLPVSEDIAKLKRCHIAVGTPGRLKQLIETGAFNTESVRLFVLDEADKLMEQDFQEDINWIYSTLPNSKQMMTLSATYPDLLARHITKYMRSPMFVRLNALDPALLGVGQYSKILPLQHVAQQVFDTKLISLIELLSLVDFHQCLVFTNYQMRAQSLCERLSASGWPAACISAAQDQHDRLKAMSQLKKFQCRILISTDLTARGIDAENVNLIVNFDVPRDHETYLHRVGRAGRFGTFGAAVSMVSGDHELKLLRDIETKCNTTITVLPEPIPADLARSSRGVSLYSLVTAERISTAEERVASDIHLQLTSREEGVDVITEDRKNCSSDISKDDELISSVEDESREPPAINVTPACVEQIMSTKLNADTTVSFSDLSPATSVPTKLVVFSNVLKEKISDDSKMCFSTRKHWSFLDMIADHCNHQVVEGENHSSMTKVKQCKIIADERSLESYQEEKMQSLAQFLITSKLEYAKRFPKSASLLCALCEEDNLVIDEKPSQVDTQDVTKQLTSDISDSTSSCTTEMHLSCTSSQIKATSMSRKDLLSFRETKVKLSPNVVARIEELQLRRFSSQPPSHKLRKPQPKPTRSFDSIISASIQSETVQDQFNNTGNSFSNLASTVVVESNRIMVEESVLPLACPHLTTSSSIIAQVNTIMSLTVPSQPETPVMSTTVIPSSSSPPVDVICHESAHDLKTKESAVSDVTKSSLEFAQSLVSGAHDYQTASRFSVDVANREKNVTKNSVPSVEQYEFDEHILSKYVAAGFKDKFKKISLPPGCELTQPSVVVGIAQGEKMWKSTEGSRPRQYHRTNGLSSGSSSILSEDSKNQKCNRACHNKAIDEQYRVRPSDGQPPHSHGAKRINRQSKHRTRREGESSVHEHYDQYCKNYVKWFEYGYQNDYGLWPTHGYRDPCCASSMCYSSYLLGARDACSQMAVCYDSIRKYVNKYDYDKYFARQWQQQADYIREMSQAYVDVNRKESKK